MPSARKPGLKPLPDTESDSDDELGEFEACSRPTGFVVIAMSAVALVAIVAVVYVGHEGSRPRASDSGLGGPSPVRARGFDRGDSRLQDSAASAASCARQGCSDRRGKACACDSECVVRKDCCADYVEVCSANGDVTHKAAYESWSFEPEIASAPRMIAEGVYFDPEAPPPLYTKGCESESGWTNGFEHAAKSRLTQNLTQTAAVGASALYSSAGFTCKAYAAGGWCSKPWALGPFANYPERHCCACGGGVHLDQLAAECGEASGKCAEDVRQALETGVREHPERYPGLTSDSRLEDFQALLASRNESGCIRPCRNPKVARPAGCPRRAYDGERAGPAFCFAQLAGNSGVQGSPCGCRQGCGEGNLVAATRETVAFTNLKSLGRSTKACARDVLLTIPREFYRDYGDLRIRCGSEGMKVMTEVLMRDAWNAYHAKLCPSRTEPLWQCFHSPRIASVPYIHMQTFSAYAYFHGMPTTNKNVGICVKQSRAEEVHELAEKLARMM